LNAIWTTAVSSTAFTGTLLLDTLLSCTENGSPLSRANAYTARDPSAIKELAQTTAMTMIMDDNVDAPAML
jgi:hypothetical protein